MIFIRSLLMLCLLCLLPLKAIAAPPAWKIIPSQSSLSFTATQNGSPVTGQFKQFSGEIYFDPLKLIGSHVKIIVTTGSVYTSYGQVAETLVTDDWFDVKLFPEAIFNANDFIKTGDKKYQAKGTLTLRGKTEPIVVTFKDEGSTDSSAIVSGETHLKRSLFGVGQGDFASTDTIKDEVQVHFTLSVVKK